MEIKYFGKKSLLALKKVFALKAHGHNNASSTESGFLSNTDKNKLDGIDTGANKTIVDASLSASSTNPVQNKIIKAALDQKAPSNHQHGEATLLWGGAGLSERISPIDTAASYLHSANRFQFANAAGIEIEYSTDGSTYLPYDTTDDKKVGLVSGIDQKYYVGGRETGNTINDKLRITLDPNKMKVYTRLQKMLINVSTNGSSKCSVFVEKALKTSPDTFSEVGTYSVGGWSGWNSIPFDGTLFGGGSDYGTAFIRLTFSSGVVGARGLQILSILAIGDTYWTTPSDMARTGHLYGWDVDKNATFPGSIKAIQFYGNIDGTASKATADNRGQAIDSTYVKELSINGKTITYKKGSGMTHTIITQDTTYELGTQSYAGIGKLYPTTGDASDGSMTQAAITSALSNASGTKVVISASEPSCNVNDEWLLPY